MRFKELIVELVVYEVFFVDVEIELRYAHCSSIPKLELIPYYDNSRNAITICPTAVRFVPNWYLNRNVVADNKLPPVDGHTSDLDVINVWGLDQPFPKPPWVWVGLPITAA